MNAHIKGAKDPKGFDNIVKEIFAPIYPVISQQIIEKTSLVEGKCLDAGCGTGALGRAFAKKTKMQITFFDKSHEMLNLSKQYVNDENLSNRSSFLFGDIHDIPCENESFDLVISRGSTPFWDDWSKAYDEIFRILKIGGQAYIGGGFGNKNLRNQIRKKMEEKEPNWRNSFKDRLEEKKETLPKIIKDLKPTYFEIIDNESGFWLYMKK
ncbi:class I SAM-dependent methyltransferase [Arcobacter sp. L]|uniref:class I SAM-dependent methyltransferase n=1 Tax=Arcobacter sp. L TaxID=944547 RepID=UPI0002296163|nr:class I SAM-dependent methyltransferase [Arcobacter sp. L]BAK73995.1 methyltransferase [Arcobacter sp. L]